MVDDISDHQGERSRNLVDEVRNDPSSTIDLISHFYRAELDRTTAWRQRLDQTTNWTVVIVAAILTWTFSSQDNPHYVLLIGMVATVAFLLIEAHRFREYDIWRSRVRELQRNLFAGVLFPDSPTDDGWQRTVAESLEQPEYTLSARKAITHRLRRIYFPLLLILLIAWVARISVFQTDEPWRQTAAILGLSGEVIVFAVGLVYLLLASLTVFSARGSETIEIDD